MAYQPGPNIAEEELLARLETCRDVAGFVQEEYADKVQLPDSALRTVDELTDSPSARAWAQSAYLGFRALHTYATVKPATGFYLWCKDSGNEAAVFPVGLISMRESERIESNASLKTARTFTVPGRIDPSEVLFMPAHLKPGGGATDAPRIHFHDDVKGKSGQIWVGYFGPHLPT